MYIGQPRSRYKNIYGDIYGRTRMDEMKLIVMCHDKVISVKCPDQTLTAGYLCEVS